MGNRQTHLNISNNNSVPINSLCNESQTNDLRRNRNKKMGKKDTHNTKLICFNNSLRILSNPKALNLIKTF
jgi:hypothetical protein